MVLIPATVAIIFAGAAIANSRLDELDAETRELLTIIHDACVDKTEVDVGLIEKASHGNFEPDDKFKDYLGCVYQQTGALSDNGEADYDTMLELLPEKFQERAGKMIQKCRHIRGSSAASTAFELNKCLYTADPEYYLII